MANRAMQLRTPHQVSTGPWPRGSPPITVPLRRYFLSHSPADVDHEMVVIRRQAHLASAIRQQSTLSRRPFRPFRQTVALIVIAFLAVACTGCGSVKVTVQSETPHRDAEGKPLPVVVRLYQLSGKERFQKADFLSLARNDQKLLEKDILWRKEITLFPNSEMVLKEERKKGAEYFAVMALFREKGSAWRQIVDLNKLWTPCVKVTIQERTVTAD